MLLVIFLLLRDFPLRQFPNVSGGDFSSPLTLRTITVSKSLHSLSKLGREGVQQHYESGGFSGRVLWTVNSFFVFDRELVHNLLPRLGGMDLRVNCGRIVQLWCFKRIFHFLLSLRTEDDKRSITLSTLDVVSWMISCLEGGTKKKIVWHIWTSDPQQRGRSLWTWQTEI